MNFKLHEDPERTTAIGMTRYAHEFLQAAILVYSNEEWWSENEHVPIPAYYLVAHSTELILKAYLLKLGVGLKPIKALGHDLCRCLDAANAHGLSSHVKFSDDELVALKLLNDLFATKQLNYIVTGAKTLSYFKWNSSAAVKLCNTVAELVGFFGRVQDLNLAPRNSTGSKSS